MPQGILGRGRDGSFSSWLRRAKFFVPVIAENRFVFVTDGLDWTGDPVYLRFIIQPINVPAVKPTANVVATVRTKCRWMEDAR